MGAQSKIEWTDATWNPVRGCTRISPGCGGPRDEGGCYAEAQAARFSDPGQPFHGFAVRTPKGGRWTGKLALLPDKLREPLSWREPRKVFVNSMTDLFHENLSDDAIDRVFAVMALCPQHTFQVLTKRSARMRDYLADPETPGRVGDLICDLTMSMRLPVVLIAPGMDEAAAPMGPRVYLGAWPQPNVWLGVSVEDQARANERREDLRATPAAIRFVSYEPALGPVDWRGWEFLDWLIAGGESGRKARPPHPEWMRAARDFSATNGIAFFLKQWGEWWPQECNPLADQRFAERLKAARIIPSPARPERGCWDARGEWRPGSIAGGPPAYTMWRLGKNASGRLLDGRTHDAFPEARR